MLYSANLIEVNRLTIISIWIEIMFCNAIAVILFDSVMLIFVFFLQGEWEEALAAMDKAIADMPRTKHRL